ncbi:MAG: hypothetical protein Ct9H300mP13_7560 [Gammaproteobacteria bacterium]|nr:MAG: hypothetical protein Ct9H300mP13_7560 [Gammaproteobacteria bacterium]
MTAITPGAPNHEGLAPLASRFVNVDGLPWEPSQFPGIDFKTLLIEPDTGLLTALVRMAPGSTLPDHQHVQIEQTYVIDGAWSTKMALSGQANLYGAPLEAATLPST